MRVFKSSSLARHWLGTSTWLAEKNLIRENSDYAKCLIADLALLVTQYSPLLLVAVVEQGAGGCHFVTQSLQMLYLIAGLRCRWRRCPCGCGRFR